MYTNTHASERIWLVITLMTCQIIVDSTHEPTLVRTQCSAIHIAAFVSTTIWSLFHLKTAEIASANQPRPQRFLPRRTLHTAHYHIWQDGRQRPI